MAIRDENLSEPLLLGTSTAQIGDTVPSSERWRIKAMVLTNKDSTNRTVTVYRVNSGSPNENHKIIGNLTIPANNVRTPPVAGLILEAGWSIWARASASDSIAFNCVMRKEIFNV